MGNHSSKSTEIADNNKQNINILLDPRSPDINRTPLTGISSNRVRKNVSTPSTPKNSSRQMQKSNFDPRSPSQFIPRTPLNISLEGDKVENSCTLYSLEYSGLVEEASCRYFNERLENLTFDSSFTEPQNDKHTEKKEPQPPVKNISCPGACADVKENNSPYIRAAPTFSSTPNFDFNAKQNKKLEYFSPVKKMGNIKEFRTPFGSLLNKSFDNLSQQQKFKINNTIDENYTPKMKKKSKNGGIRKNKKIFCD